MGLASLRLLAGCVLAVAFLAERGHAQLVVPKPVEPVVLSGADIGFRMTGRRGDTPVGNLVVSIDGEWREVAFAVGVKPAAK